MPRGSLPGERRGGRKKGTQNHLTVERKARITQAMMAGITPIEFMLDILRDTKRDDAVRMDAARSAAPYVHPRLATTAHTGPDGGPVQLSEIKIRLVKAGEE